MDFAYHRSLEKILKGSQEWLDHPNNKNSPAEYSAVLQAWLAEPQRPATLKGMPLHFLGHCYGIAACDAYWSHDLVGLARHLRWAVDLRALDLRLKAMFSQQNPEEAGWLREFWDSMKAAGPLMLSEWKLGQVCAERFIQMAEQDQRVGQPSATRMINHNTNDVFLIGLFSQAFDISTDFQPREPLIEPYQQLLDTWRTKDESVFQSAMQAASEFHISRSKSGSRYKFCEFEKTFDRVFAAELLAVQALRLRDDLPAFEAGHLLVDGPWAVIKDLPEAEPNPLTIQVEAQLHRDYPDFR